MSIMKYFFLFCLDYLSPLIAPANLSELMDSSDVVGNIRFSHPTLYVFPGGQGDAALFGINGFNMLGKCIKRINNLEISKIKHN